MKAPKKFTHKEVIGNATLYLGDSRDILPLIATCDSVVTDPPYGLSFMGKKWDYDVPDEALWRLCLRVLKPGGHLLSFAGTRTQHRMAVRIEDAGFEIRDMIAWIYGSGFPKSLDVSKAIEKAETVPAAESAKQWEGFGTALKPAHEPITVARKPLIGTVSSNVQAHGTGALNIDGCRVSGETPSSDRRATARKTGNTPGRPGEYGRSLKNRITLEAYLKVREGESLGRWPANLIHDGSDEVVDLFPESNGGGYPAEGGQRSHGSTFGKPSARGIQRFKSGEGGHGSAARFFYCAKTSKKDRDEGCEGLETKSNMRVNGPRESEKEKFATVRANHHPTVKPTDLMRYLCRLVTPPRGIVLDPFMGSGSTGKAAMMEGFKFIGIERDPAYFEIAYQRIRNAHKIARKS